MRQSTVFTKVRREAPSDEISLNARLLIQAGYVDKVMAGVYSYLPFGLRVLQNITRIIREEMDALGAQELLLTAFQNPEIWQKSGRWEGDVWFKTELRAGGTIGLGWTQEEEITETMKRHIQSHKDLPRAVYQIQTKFRNEERAKSGIMRGREFLMKDLYSFHTDAADLDRFYDLVKDAYVRIFERVGIGEHTYPTIASGGVFSPWSHEFQTLSEAGEDSIFYSKEKGIAINKEVLSPELCAQLGLKQEELTSAKAIEVGNIFKLGTRFSEPLGLVYTNESGERVPVVMGSYGIGPGRLMGTIAELSSDENGLVWPEAVAPFTYHLVALPDKAGAVLPQADVLYRTLVDSGATVLYDDRVDVSAGEKFSDSDLIGIPTRLVVSERTLAEGKVERKNRKSGEVQMLATSEIVRL